MITKYELQQTTNKIIAECIRSCLWTMTLFLKSNGKIKLLTSHSAYRILIKIRFMKTF